jgi:membrane-associated phospholipid phosphatase
MTVTLIVLACGVLLAAGWAGVSVLAGPSGSGPVDPEAAEHWLVVHAARFPRLRHALAAADRRLVGGAAVLVMLVAVFLAGLLIGWLLDSVNRGSGFARLDEAVAEAGAENATDASTSVLSTITELGNTSTTLFVMAVVALFDWARYRNWSVPVFLGSVGVGVSLINNTLKWLVDRDRPAVEHLVEASSSSFPSGHSATAAACWAAVALVLERELPKGARPLLIGGAAGLAGLVAASRALLGVHWLTDVLAGIVVGWTWFFLLAIVFGGRIQRIGDPAAQIRRIDSGRELTDVDGRSTR